MLSKLKDFEDVSTDELFEVDGGAGVPEGHEDMAIGGAMSAGSTYDSGRRHPSTTSNKGGGGGLQFTP